MVLVFALRNVILFLVWVFHCFVHANWSNKAKQPDLWNNSTRLVNSTNSWNIWLVRAGTFKCPSYLHQKFCYSLWGTLSGEKLFFKTFFEDIGVFALVTTRHKMLQSAVCRFQGVFVSAYPYNRTTNLVTTSLIMRRIISSATDNSWFTFVISLSCTRDVFYVPLSLLVLAAKLFWKICAGFSRPILMPFSIPSASNVKVLYHT